jgi:tetratricopeptide (TPR) repeat protein
MKEQERRAFAAERCIGRILTVLLLAGTLAACAVPAPRPAPPPHPLEPAVGAVVVDPLPEPEPLPEPAPAPEPAPPAPAPEPTAPAALALAAQSEQARAEGNLRVAGLHLERALRIAPRDAGLWNRLAQVRLEQQEFQQAERMAERSLQLGAGDRELSLSNWRIIARAREALGDTEGARRAREEVQRLERALG